MQNSWRRSCWRVCLGWLKAGASGGCLSNSARVSEHDLRTAKWTVIDEWSCVKDEYIQCRQCSQIPWQIQPDHKQPSTPFISFPWSTNRKVCRMPNPCTKEKPQWNSDICFQNRLFKMHLQIFSAFGSALVVTIVIKGAAAASGRVRFFAK